MTDPAIDSDSVDLAAALLMYYSFDLAGQPIERLIAVWIQRHPSEWLGMSVVEALYQGRYKAVSVGQILQIWNRRGHPICHFNSEFEKMVCDPVQLLLFRKRELRAGEFRTGDDPSCHDLTSHTLTSHTLTSHTTDLSLGTPNSSLSQESGNNPTNGTMRASQDGNRLDLRGIDRTAYVDHHFATAERLVHTSASNISGIQAESEHHAPESTDGNATMALGDRPHPGDLSFSKNDPSTDRESILFSREGTQPIRRFVPNARLSGFYSRLQAVALTESPLNDSYSDETLSQASSPTAVSPVIPPRDTPSPDVTRSSDVYSDIASSEKSVSSEKGSNDGSDGTVSRRDSSAYPSSVPSTPLNSEAHVDSENPDLSPYPS